MENASTDDRRKLGRIVGILIRVAALGTLALLALSLFAHTIIDTDIWWHLRTGQYIVETGTIPKADMYSYTAAGNRWIDLHWLFQVIAFDTYRAGGSYGLSLLFIAIYSSAFLILWKACRPRGAERLAVAVLLFAIALLASSFRFLARPEAFTFLMIALFVTILLRHEQGKARRLVYVLIPLQVVWTNLQGLFIVGPCLVLAFLAGSTLARFARWTEQDAAAADAARIRPLLITLAGSLLACLASPYGIHGLLFPLTLFTRVGGMENIFSASIAEFQPPFSGYNPTSATRWFAVFLACSAAVLILDYRAFRFSHLFVVLGLGYLALNARRNVPIYVLAVLPLAVIHADNLIAQLCAVRKGRFDTVVIWVDRVACVAIAAVLIIQVRSVVSNRYYHADKRVERFGFGFKEQTFPHGAFVFLKEQGIRGPFFNNLNVGGLFIWEMYPDEKVFIDPRLEVNSAEMLTRYRRAMADPAAFARLSGDYAFNAVIVSHTAQDALNLLPALYSSREWVLVYLDPIAAIFVRVIPANRHVVQTRRIRLGRDVVAPIAPNDTLNDSTPQSLRAALGKLGSIAPTDTAAQNRFNLGLVFLVTGEYIRSIKLLKSGLDLMPSSAEGHYNIGLAYERLGGADAAVSYYERAIELNARHARAHANLGRIYDDRGLDELAEREYKLAIATDKDNPIPLYNLGALLHQRGDHEAARVYWQRALQVDPSFEPARQALQTLE